MKVLLFVLLPALVVAAYAVYTWMRNRQPSSVESGIDAFRREMTALSPEAAPVNRRVEPRPGGEGSPAVRRRPEEPGTRRDGPGGPVR